MTRTEALKWTCSVCKLPIVGDAGYVGAEYEEIRDGKPIHWTVYHDACHPDDFIYSVDVAQMVDTLGVDKWTDHLAGKNWYLRSNWRQIVLAETGYAIPAFVDWHADSGTDHQRSLAVQPLAEILTSTKFPKAVLVDAMTPLIDPRDARKTAEANRKAVKKTPKKITYQQHVAKALAAFNKLVDRRYRLESEIGRGGGRR